MTDINKMFETFINNLTEEQKSTLIQTMTVLSQPKTQETEKMSEVLENVIEPPKKVVSSSNDFTMIKDNNVSKGKTQVKFKKNSWQDTGEFRDEEDLKTPKYSPTPRNREKAKKIEVECHVCGKTFFEDPKYVYGEYLRCSKCGRR